ncbi:MAG: VOC family protein [Chloroflexi bacterium]|nr:VOC family protein [Chloroflexota bacterium]
MDIICTRTVIRTARFDECYRYYGEVLGWPIFVEYAGRERRGACFGTREWGIEIIDDPEAGSDDERSRGAMEVADVHALREELAGRLPALPPVAEETWAYSLTLAAPDGYRIKFFSRRVPAGSGNAAAR